MKREEYNKLKEEWIINGCWWNKWFNFSKFFKDNVTTLDQFLPIKSASLIDDIELTCCWPHDVSFYNWGWYFSWILANIKFSINLYKLLGWTTFFQRIWIALIVFILLQKHSKTYYNFTK